MRDVLQLAVSESSSTEQTFTLFRAVQSCYSSAAVLMQARKAAMKVVAPSDCDCTGLRPAASQDKSDAKVFIQRL